MTLADTSDTSEKYNERCVSRRQDRWYEHTHFVFWCCHDNGPVSTDSSAVNFLVCQREKAQSMCSHKKHSHKKHTRLPVSASKGRPPEEMSTERGEPNPAINPPERQTPSAEGLIKSLVPRVCCSRCGNGVLGPPTDLHVTICAHHTALLFTLQLCWGRLSLGIGAVKIERRSPEHTLLTGFQR